jgi:hypothetical protein
MIGRPSTQTYLRIVDNKELRNCPVTRGDIFIADTIFGPDLGSLKGKTVWQGANHVKTSLTDIPTTIMSHYRELVLGRDIMFVNKIPFFMTISRHVKFGTDEMQKNQQNKTILAAIKQVKIIYLKRGFQVTHMLMDGQFESLRANLANLQINLNMVSNDEHIPKIKQRICTVKERTRCIYNTFPFCQVPPRMIVEMVYSSNFWLNSFPPEDGVSITLSPRAIVVGMELDYSKHCQLEFGTYVQTHKDHDNLMASCTTGTIALRPTGNAQGGYYFYSLTTGRCINRNCWTSLRMPNDVIDRIRNLAQQAQANLGLLFSDRDGHPIITVDDADDNDSDDESYDPDSESDNGDDDDYMDHVDDIHIAGVNDNDENNENEIIEANDEILEANKEANDNKTIEDNNKNEIIDANEINEANENETTTNSQSDDEQSNTMEDDDDDKMESNNNQPIEPEDNMLVLANEMETKYGARTGMHALRPRRPRDYGHLHTTLESTPMTQHSMKKVSEYLAKQAQPPC